MRNILILCGLILAGLTGWLIWKFTAPQHFGQPFQGLKPAALSDLVTQPERFQSGPVAVNGIVFRQCPVTGCWFYLKSPEGKELRVELGDVVPGLPQKVGSTARVEGQLKKLGETYVLYGNGVEFGRKEEAPAASALQEKVQAAAQSSQPMADGYPVDFCIVGGEKLGSMGDPVVYVHEGRTVKFCCKGCIHSFQKDPARFLSVLDRAAGEAKAKP